MKTNQPTLDDLADALEGAKAAENAAKVRRMRDEGSTTVGRVTVTTGYTDKWNQSQLDQLSIGVDPATFPFRREWKPDGRALKVFAERYPSYVDGLREALTRTRKKNAVKVAPRKEEAA